MKKAVLILAGGSGTRAGGDKPKQFQPLAGKPMILHSIEAFISEDADIRIVLVVHPDWIDDLQQMLNDSPLRSCAFTITAGGSSRLESVSRGLAALQGMAEDTLVAVHDAARPMVSPELIARGWACAAEADGAVPVVPLSDSIRRRTSDTESEAADRADFCLVQTPQVFPLPLLREAYTAADFADPALTDDASVVERFGRKVSLYPGDPANMKVTNHIDFAIAEALIANG